MKAKRIFFILAVVGLAGGGLAWRFGGKPSGGQYRTVRIERGGLVQTVRATGVIQPVKLVQVGTQVNGPVRKLYVDFNDRVKAGDLVAQIDPTVYEAQLARDEANLKQSLASVEQVLARMVPASNELVRAGELARRDMISKAELDAAVADHDGLAAQLKVAQAAVEQSQAALRLSRANLGYTTIRSPVDGVVIARNVDEGQTVVANLSAQVLFQIAADLQQVQVVASIPEADIGKIRAGQPVSFTVDAYEQEFTGTVAQVRMSAATVQNVVTYPVVVSAGNPDGRLFPSMTANLSCEVVRLTDVLKVPNAALRFKPAQAVEAGGGKGGAGGGGRGLKSGGAKLWIQGGPGEAPRPVPVRTGITDGVATELVLSERGGHGRGDPGGEYAKIEEGQEVIVGLADKGAAASAAVVNPFTPQMPGGRRPPRGPP